MKLECGVVTCAVIGATWLIGGCSSDDPSSNGRGAGTAGTGGSAGAAGQAGSSGSASGGSTSGSDAGGSGPQAGQPLLPEATGPCPEFKDGEITLKPKGIAPRKARVWMSDAAKTKEGPILFYWHGTGSSHNVAGAAFASVRDEILEAGGLLIAPHRDSAAGVFPWYLTVGQKQDDLLVADEIVACAEAELNIDETRIHSTGMSAGGLHTSQMALLRSNYLASVVSYSGGLLADSTESQRADNKFAAMIYHGGDSDVVVGVQFKAAGERFHERLQKDGHFSFICDHGTGHSLPFDSTASSWQFMKDHPYGTDPSPYASALPSGFPSYCSL